MSEDSQSQQNNPIVTDKDIKEARARLWAMGILEWKLDITQKKIYDFFINNQNKLTVVTASRRLGKSFALTIIALEQCLKHPKSIVKFLQPEVKMIRMNIRPVMIKILEDCPKELRPEFKTQDNVYIFPNGSEIHLAGTDNGNHEKLRGSDCHLALVDEAGFCSELDYIVHSILTPTTLITRGKIILSSTVPPNPDHEFIKFMDSGEKSNSFIKKTIFDAVDDNKNLPNPRITEEIVAEILQAYPDGVNSDAFRTEYNCEIIFNSEDAVVPEFIEAEKDIVTVWPKPSFYDKYVAMDIGFVDLTVVLFGFWDFDNGVLVIEDEFVINGHKLTTTTLAENIKKYEEKLWTNPFTGEFEEPYRRVSDNNLIVINDLQRDHGLTFLPTDKVNKDANINALRNMISSRQIAINPKCTTLISHLKSATWDKSHKSFRRSADNAHFDAVDSLTYMVRNIDKSRSPYPKGYRHSQIGSYSSRFISPHAKDEANQSYEKLAGLFKRKK